jgi:hypothetical protein
MKLLIMQFSQISRHLIILQLKYSPQHPVLETPSVCIPLLMSETKFHAHTETQKKKKKKLILYIPIFKFEDSRREVKRFWTEW